MSDERPDTMPRKRRAAKSRLRKERPEPVTVDTDWRVFLAVPLPPEVISRISEMIDALSTHDWPVRWVDPESAHLTLHFLGETPPEQVEIVRLALPPIVAAHESFDLRTAGLGAFPKLQRPRVIWLGLWGPAHRLESIYNDLGDTLDDLMFDIEERPFQPHITLGRLRDTSNVATRHLPEQIRQAFADLEEAGLADPKRSIPVPIREVHLIRSHLQPTDARYEIIDRFPLDAKSQDDESL